MSSKYYEKIRIITDEFVLKPSSTRKPVLLKIKQIVVSI
jgi:hypothetical protein